jgi:dienelactone hydrolase
MSKDDVTEMVLQKNVFFNNHEGKKIAGVLDLPDGDGHFPAVVIVHGFKGFKEQAHLAAIANALANAGIVALRFDVSNGLGESDGDPFDFKFSEFLDDTTSALDFLQTLSYVDKSHIGMTGHSLGGQVTLILAAKDGRVKAIVPMCSVFIPGTTSSLVDPDGSWKKNGHKEFTSKTLGRTFKMSYKFHEDWSKYDAPEMKRIVTHIKVPTRVIQSGNDESVPLDTSHQLRESLNCEKELCVIKGAPHTFTETTQIEEVSTLVVDWFEKHLK